VRGAAIAVGLAVLGWALSRSSSSSSSVPDDAGGVPAQPHSPTTTPPAEPAPEPLPPATVAILELAGSLPRDLNRTSAALLGSAYPAAAEVEELYAGHAELGRAAIVALSRTASVYASPWGDDDGWDLADVAPCLWLTGWTGPTPSLSAEPVWPIVAGVAWSRFDAVSDLGTLTVRRMVPELELGPWGLGPLDLEAAARLVIATWPGPSAQWPAPGAEGWQTGDGAVLGATAWAETLVFESWQTAREAGFFGDVNRPFPKGTGQLAAELGYVASDPVLCAMLVTALIVGYGPEAARSVWGLDPLIFDCGPGPFQVPGVAYQT